ncbi:MAG: nuclease-related domain-containing protein [Clostridia bacterium]
MQIVLLVLALVVGATGIKILFINYKLKKSNYQESSGNNLWKIVFNKGNYGEFLTYAILEKTGESRILCNVYLTKTDGKTTEVDLIAINTSGIFVHESKNYSGWIFGNENSKNWTQSLQNKQKNKFYNPIMQNKGHIRAINETLEKKYSNMFLSYIIFSERCELKKITVTSENVRVFKRNKLGKQLIADKEKIGDRLTIEEVDEIYFTLKQYTLASDEVKKKHVEEIKNNAL